MPALLYVAGSVAAAVALSIGTPAAGVPRPGAERVGEGIVVTAAALASRRPQSGLAVVIATATVAIIEGEHAGYLTWWVDVLFTASVLSAAGFAGLERTRRDQCSWRRRHRLRRHAPAPHDPPAT